MDNNKNMDNNKKLSINEYSALKTFFYSIFSLLFIIISSLIIATIVQIILEKILNVSLYYMVMNLIFAILIILFSIIWVKYIEKVDIKSRLGLFENNKIKSYLKGSILGFITLLIIIIFIVIFTKSTIGLSNIVVKPLILYLIFFIFQGASEEFIIRGILLPLISKRYGIYAGVIISSSIFAILHLFNPGITIVSVLNLFLAGIWFAYLYIYYQNIIIVCAIHSIWNYALNCIFGLQVSGIDLNASILNISIPNSANTLISGGKFGPEGSIFTTIVLAIFIIILHIKLKDKRKTFY